MGLNNNGNKINANVIGLNSSIQIGDNSTGCEISGVASGGGSMNIDPLVNGSIIHGLVDGTSLLGHRISSSGSASFGLNNLITPPASVIGSDAEYSFAMGNSALAYIRGSMAHSSTQRFGPGDGQYFRVNFHGLSSGDTAQLLTGENITPYLCYGGYAVGTIAIVGKKGSYAYGRIYINTTIPGTPLVYENGGIFTFSSGITMGPDFTSVNNQFSLTVHGVIPNEDLTATLKLTMISI
jgi:hypothetical protein